MHRVQVIPAKRGKDKKPKRLISCKTNACRTPRLDDTGPAIEAGYYSCGTSLYRPYGAAYGCANQLSCRFINIDIETCRECGGAAKVIACIEDPVVIEKILTHLKEKVGYWNESCATR